jgi:hypothetical protein
MVWALWNIQILDRNLNGLSHSITGSQDVHLFGILTVLVLIFLRKVATSTSMKIVVVCTVSPKIEWYAILIPDLKSWCSDGYGI